MRSFLFRLIIILTSLFPLTWTRRFARSIAALFWRFSKKHRHITNTNIALCYPQMDSEQQQILAKETVLENTTSLFELGHIWRRHGTDINPLIQRIHNEEILHQALAQGQGVLLAAPHLGNWEVLGLYLSALERFSLLYKPPKDASIEHLIHHYRGQSGANQITADSSGVKKILVALKQQHLIGILPDQQPKSGQGVFADFFGVPAYTMSLFSRIAAKTRTPVIMAAAIRTHKPAGFEIHFRQVSDDIYEDTETSVAALNKAIQDMVAIAPSQYQWTYKRFSIQEGDNPYQVKSKAAG
ncbi:lysophospholipid acyltransferase family protein [Marinicella sp. W31]|uniref:lysophospholipid acyltransferase family protein n=1 Tax=Marinicella sp. W31 TaxID=3023713 RepID=UPI0037564381